MDEAPLVSFAFVPSLFCPIFFLLEAIHKVAYDLSIIDPFRFPPVLLALSIYCVRYIYFRYSNIDLFFNTTRGMVAHISPAGNDTLHKRLPDRRLRQRRHLTWSTSRPACQHSQTFFIYESGCLLITPRCTTIAKRLSFSCTQATLQTRPVQNIWMLSHSRIPHLDDVAAIGACQNLNHPAINQIHLDLFPPQPARCDAPRNLQRFLSCLETSRS
ncbi:hypothetical protein BDP81DRAFT_141492 [Colletotrichum phormii]|uniref:Uncharacterized protein n=1 Tax=Colletotrichum phormii TaxID=359342 RepID=A0AAI9ZEC1_9PEZI|nr:uncharacterized protein BDP81DRAFT_141492 [Colletotrichum phormii]KAK1622973.1 hypothetical protein BDP81DRAFT_141492 [Colletotrichum phormii]